MKTANKAKLLIIADEKGMRAEIEGTPSDGMCLVKAALENQWSYYQQRNLYHCGD